MTEKSFLLVTGLPPCGGSGLKYQLYQMLHGLLLSPSMRMEWIEIDSRSEYGNLLVRLPPCGGSGLKYKMCMTCDYNLWSPSMRREWIEIPGRKRDKQSISSSPSMRREWIEIPAVSDVTRIVASPSMRREWIEIPLRNHPQIDQICLPPCGGSGLK